jgi:hypothetical protein
MMDNTYPNDEFIRRTANFREAFTGFMQTTDDEGNPNPDYTLEAQTKLYETMLDKAYDLALFIESQESDGYRLVKADTDPVQDVTPDDDEWLQNVLSDDEEAEDELPHWLVDDPDVRAFTLTDQARAMLSQTGGE